MLKDSIHLAGLLVIVLSMASCGSVKKVSVPEGSVNGSSAINLPRVFEGAWVMQLSCDSRPKMNSNTEYGILEISKEGRTSYEAVFYVFEERKGMRASSLNLNYGSILNMEGSSTNGGNKIELAGDEWLLKSNRQAPIGFVGSLSEDGFFLKGKITGDVSCPDFTASRFITNDAVERNPIFPLKDLFDELESSRKNPLDQEQCTEIFNFLGSGYSEMLIDSKRASDHLEVNSVLLDEKSSIRYFGKTYRNWTFEDSQAFVTILNACGRSRHLVNNRELDIAYNRYSSSHTYPFFNVGKDTPNDRRFKIPKLFSMFATTPHNVRWAGNYFVLSAVKSARLYEKIIVQRLENLPMSEESIEEIGGVLNNINASFYSAFPLIFLPDSNKNEFKPRISALYKDRQNAHIEKLFSTFDVSQYPKTLEGYKSLKRGLSGIKGNIDALADVSKREEMRGLYQGMLEKHAQEASEDIIANVAINLPPEHYTKPADILAGALSLIATSPYDELSAFVDTYVASRIKDEVNTVKPSIADATLHELTQITEYLSNFPSSPSSAKFKETRPLLKALADDLALLIVQRVEALQLLAEEIIQETGTDYTDVGAILETGFSLAEEFEEAGFVDVGKVLILTTASHVDNILRSGLQGYKDELNTIEFTSEIAAALQEQVIVFDELGKEIEEFGAYKQAAEDVLKLKRASICESILGEASVDKQHYQNRISIGENQQLTLTDFTCALYDNNHILTEFSRSEKGFVLGIDEGDGEQSQFLIEADNTSGSKNLIIQKQLNIDISNLIQEAQDYVARLVRPKPSGKADANGVRECDLLAADPHDLGKLANGVDFVNEDISLDLFDRAIDSCIAAVEDDPKDVRQLFQLGRVLWYAGDQESASEYMGIASVGGYAPATYYMAEILLGTSSDPDAFVDALDMFEASGNGGYARGSAMVKELNPDGIDFYKEIPSPTADDIYNALRNKQLSSPKFAGVSVSARIGNVYVKSCMQIAKMDFACEFTTKMSCSSSDAGVSMVLGFLCNASRGDLHFKSFRKKDNGSWMELASQN